MIESPDLSEPAPIDRVPGRSRCSAWSDPGLPLAAIAAIMRATKKDDGVGRDDTPGTLGGKGEPHQMVLREDGTCDPYVHAPHDGNILRPSFHRLDTKLGLMSGKWWQCGTSLPVRPVALAPHLPKGYTLSAAGCS